MVLVSCATQAKPKKLTFGLISYMSFREVEEILNKMDAKWSITEHTTLEKGDLRPRYELLTLETTIFKANGFTGKTNLVFFNNQLMSVIFYPDNWNNYKIYLKEVKKISLNQKDQWRAKNEGVYMAINKDFNDRYYFLWEDMALKEEITIWIRKYS